MTTEEIKDLQDSIQAIDELERAGLRTQWHAEKKMLTKWLITEMIGNASYQRLVRFQTVVIAALACLLLVCLMAFQDTETIQAQFADLSADERSEFMTWAMTDEMRYEVCK